MIGATTQPGDCDDRSRKGGKMASSISNTVRLARLPALVFVVVPEVSTVAGAGAGAGAAGEG